uniref:Uncharacterized protein n=1 Tax=Rhizophora mucronata TaxID=61149 RepID=A0A2P2QKP4_RHIMU
MANRKEIEAHEWKLMSGEIKTLRGSIGVIVT